jgi:hypothetical protein
MSSKLSVERLYGGVALGVQFCCDPDAWVIDVALLFWTVTWVIDRPTPEAP